MKTILVIICWEHGCFCKLDSFLKLTYCVDIEGFRISLCLHFTCLHNQTWTPLRHICWTIPVYETLKICNLFNTLCAITLIFIQESMNRVHDLISETEKLWTKFQRLLSHYWYSWFTKPTSKHVFLRLLYWVD